MMEKLGNINLSQFTISVSLLIVGLVLAKLATKGIAKFGKERLSQHQSILLQRIGYYLVITMFAFTALQQLGIDLGVLLGAAGILTVALGFASQTSASNVISGLFLLGERPFAVGDSIRIGSTTGEVISIDLLSVKLRTFDNLFVRIPNENIIKSEVTTLTRFPIRRFDLVIGVAYKEDLKKVKEILLKVSSDYHLCLEDPEPQYMLTGFGDSSINIQFSLWTKRENFLKFKNGIIERVKKAFDDNNIEIPFPHRTIYFTESSPALNVKSQERNDENLYD